MTPDNDDANDDTNGNGRDIATGQGKLRLTGPANLNSSVGNLI